MAISLTELGASHGFTAGDLDTNGWFAMIPAFQEIFFADGRMNGYHVLDMYRTKLTGTITGAFKDTEYIEQEDSEAKGYFIGTDGTNHLVYRISTIEFNTTDEITGSVSGATLTPTAVTAPPHWDVWTESLAATSDVHGTAASGTSTSLTDSNIAGTYTDDYFNGKVLKVTGGTGIYETATITDYDGTLGKFIFSALSGGSTPDATTVYSVYSIATGLPEGGANAGCLCFGRIFLNSIINPNQWYSSRAGNPRDWLVNQNDLGTPVSSQTSKAGLVSSPLVGFIPYQDHYLLFGLMDSWWVMRSDPRAGGTLTQLTTETGMLSPTAYCWDENSNLFILGFDGVYYLPPTGIINAQAPVNITRGRMPRLFRDMAINKNTDNISMAYDKDRYGIRIAVTQKDGEWETSFWIDLRSGDVLEEGGKIFPESYNKAHRAHSLYYYQSQNAVNRALLIGCDDGYIRRYDDDSKSDDSEAIKSFFTVGPFVSEVTRGTIKHNETSIELDSNSDGITVELHISKTAQEVIEAIDNGVSAKVSKDIASNNLLRSIREKVRGGAIAIVIRNDNVDETFAIDKIDSKIEQSGRVK